MLLAADSCFLSLDWPGSESCRAVVGTLRAPSHSASKTVLCERGRELESLLSMTQLRSGKPPPYPARPEPFEGGPCPSPLSTAACLLTAFEFRNEELRAGQTKPPSMNTAHC